MVTEQPPTHWLLLPGPQLVPMAPHRCHARQRGTNYGREWWRCGPKSDPGSLLSATCQPA